MATQTFKQKERVPVELQPLVVSPRAWIWKPWRPGDKPVILPVTCVAPVHTHTYIMFHADTIKKRTMLSFLNKIQIESVRETVWFLNEMKRASNNGVSGDESHRFHRACCHFIFAATVPYASQVLKCKTFIYIIITINNKESYTCLKFSRKYII